MESRSYNAAVEEIKSRCNIVDLIQPLVPLKRTGSNFKGCCPFHKEKTPSFVVSETRQTYHCFGCGEHGDAVGFVMKYYNKTFPEAVEQLAVQYGVEINTVYAQQGKRKEPYYEANRLAARFFFSAMATPGSKGFAYMANRGIEPQTLQKFGIGYADDQWTSLTDHLKENGITDDMMAELGLSSRSQKNGKLYDKFRERVIFPIINTQGKVIGFGGRIIGDGEPKYLNSPESLVFLKKQNLFGLNLTKSEIQKEGYAIMVEGYMDVVGLYQSGVKNVAASLGTALTEQQARLLSRYTKRVLLCYDADSAGIKAALRGVDVLRDAGLEVRVLHVDDGKDPDEYVRKHGKDDFIKLVDNRSLSDIDYKVALAAKQYDIQTTDGRISFFRSAAQILSRLEPVDREIYLKKVAEEYGFSEGALRSQARGANEILPAALAPASQSEDGTLPASNGASDGQILLEKTVIRLLMGNSSFYPEAAAKPQLIVTDPGRGIFEAFAHLYRPDAEFDVTDLKDRLTEGEMAYFDQILNTVLAGDDDRKAFDDCMRKLDNATRTKRIREISDILSMADPSADPVYLNDLAKELAELNQQNKR